MTSTFADSKKQVEETIKGGSLPGETLLLSAYMVLPKGARIAISIIFFTVVLYTQFLLPSLVPGRIIIDEIPNGAIGGEIIYWVANNKNTTGVDSMTGAWSMPVFVRLPRDLHIEVKLANAEVAKVRIPFSALVISKITGTSIDLQAKRLAQRGGKEYFEVRHQSSIKPHAVVTAALSFFGVGPAYAQSVPSNTSREDVSSISEYILNDIGVITKGSAPKRTDLLLSALPNPIDQVKLALSIQGRYSVPVTTDYFREGTTIGDLSTQVFREAGFQRELEPKVIEIVKRLSKGGNYWAQGQDVPKRAIGDFFNDDVPFVHRYQLTRTPFAFASITLFNTGSQGLVFGVSGIYLKSDPVGYGGKVHAFVPYREFSEREFRVSRDGALSLDKGLYLAPSFFGAKPEFLARALNEVKNQVLQMRASQ